MTFPIRFLLCNFVLSILLGAVLLCKRISKRYVTAGSQYHIWYIFVLALLFPFIPHSAFRPFRFFTEIQNLLESRTFAVESTVSQWTDGAAGMSPLGIYDQAVSAGRSLPSVLSACFSMIWAAGCVLTALSFLFNLYKTCAMKKTAYQITAENEPDLYRIFSSCMKELKIRREVSLYASCRVSTPVSYGLLHPKIIIPQDMDIVLPAQELRFIFLHELIHYKHKDALLNYAGCILQIFYWFNPFIWYGFRVMRQDREIACDHSVVRTVGKEQALSYGYTLIRYAEKLRSNIFLSPLSFLGGRKKVMLRRIKEIADYKPESPVRKLKSVCVMLVCAILVCAASPLLAANASSDSIYRFSGHNAETIDLSSYFNGMDGAFVFYDAAEEHYWIYNKTVSTRRVAPDSTFKIYSGLFALEEGIISPDASGQSWDGTDYPFSTWNQDQTLDTAMQSSVNWYFQKLDEEAGYAVLHNYYRKIGYGNCDLSGGLDDYWAESSLKISPVEQVVLLSDLLQNKWGFAPENIQAVKDALFIGDTDMGKLYGKTGTGSTDGENTNGWFVGFLETKEKICCFAANLQGTRDASGSAASEIAMNILRDIRL